MTVLSLTWESPYLGDTTVFILRQGPNSSKYFSKCRGKLWLEQRMNNSKSWGMHNCWSRLKPDFKPVHHLYEWCSLTMGKCSGWAALNERGHISSCDTPRGAQRMRISPTHRKDYHDLLPMNLQINIQIKQKVSELMLFVVCAADFK